MTNTNAKATCVMFLFARCKLVLQVFIEKITKNGIENI